MRLLTELLARFPPLESGVLRRLQFYQLMVEIERLKEPSGKQWHALAATSSPLDISFSDKEFVALWQHNVQQTFPKDLCVSLMITDGMKEYPLFVLPFPYFEIRNLDIGTAAGVLKTPLASFSVNLMVADELDLDDEQLRALNLCLNGQTSDLSVLSQAIAETLGPRFTLAAQPLRYALSSGKPVLNNLVAELRTLSRMHSFPDVFQGFLDDSAFENEVRVCRPESLVRLSAMDEAQRNAVANALSSRVSVITGPPGCGKTQVLLNILGNAVARNLSVLVASTNNKAVDNVCERLDACGRLEDAIVRFGSKEICASRTTPQLERMESRANKLAVSASSCRRCLEESVARHESAVKRGEEAKRLMREREGLLKTLGNDEHTRYLLNRTDVSRKELDSYLHSIRRLHTSFSGRYVFIAKLWINWFTLHRHAAMAVDAFLGFPEAIRKYIETILPFHAVEQFGSGDDILKYYSAVEDGLANVASVVRVNEINSLDPDGTFSTSIKDIDENSPTFVRAALDVRLTSDGAAAAIADFKGNMTCEPYARRFIGVCPLLAVTSLSAKSSLPLVPGLFDLLVIDEASQCDVASALPIVFRAKQIVIIGDPKQLTHITSVKPEEEKCVAGHLGLDDAANLGFATMSLWDHSRNWLTHASVNAAPLLLDGHYRCHPDIIAFSNNYFYGGRLMVHTGGRSSDPGCVWIDVRGMMRPDERTNEEEANVVCEKVKVLMALYPNRSLGIVTPYKAQAELIHRRLKLDAAIDISKIVVSTVHKFQGDERDMIIYDIVLSDGARAGQIKWVDELLSNLVNVAVTRARKALYVVGNAGFVAQKSTLKSPLGALLQHVKNRGGLLEK